MDPRRRRRDGVRPRGPRSGGRDEGAGRPGTNAAVAGAVRETTCGVGGWAVGRMGGWDDPAIRRSADPPDSLAGPPRRYASGVAHRRPAADHGARRLERPRHRRAPGSAAATPEGPQAPGPPAPPAPPA